MKILIEIEVTDDDIRRLQQNSIERVLNNASRVGAYAEEHAKDIAYKEFGSVLWQDADELNSLTTRLWHAAREACNNKRRSFS